MALFLVELLDLTNGGNSEPRCLKHSFLARREENGTGKTSTLIDLVNAQLKAGVSLDRIGFFTFSKAATEEVLKRLQLPVSKPPPWFRTLHSLAFNLIGCNTRKVMQFGDYCKIAKNLGFQRPNKQQSDASSSINGTDVIKFVEEQARLRNCKWSDMETVPFSVEAYTKWSEYLSEYKQKFIKLDYIDMVVQASELPADIYPELDVCYIDEAQDLNRYQWEMVYKLMSRSKAVYIAGDDDQCIYDFNGADVQRFLSLRNEFTVQTLGQSYRVPSFIWNQAQRLISQVKDRYIKDVKSTPLVGDIWRFSSETELERYAEMLQKKTVMVLARTKSKVASLKIKTEGWLPHAKYMTIHEAKGREADVVILDCGLSRTVRKLMQEDQETRLFYVAMTRAKELLICIDRKDGYKIPY